MVTVVIATGESGKSLRLRGAAAIASTTSIPLSTTPKRVYFFGSFPRRSWWQMKNCDPLVFGPAFFICHQDLRGKLPKNYTRFGQVLSGMDVIDAIAAAPRNKNDFPESPVAMLSVTIEEA